MRCFRCISVPLSTTRGVRGQAHRWRFRKHSGDAKGFALDIPVGCVAFFNAPNHLLEMVRHKERRTLQDYRSRTRDVSKQDGNEILVGIYITG